jgi:hypothetical protein
MDDDGTLLLVGKYTIDGPSDATNQSQRVADQLRA